MSQKFFIKFVSEPKVDPMKTIIGLACAAQAVKDGHEVSVFFAGSGTRVLDPAFIKELNEKMGPDSSVISDFVNTISSGAQLACSFASVRMVLGHQQGDGALIVPDDTLIWGGPPNVIELAAASDVQFIY